VGSDFTDSLRIGNGGGSIFARGGADSLFGGTGADDLHGQDGTDHLFGGAGADVLDGGAGTDFANYSTAAAGVMASLVAPGTNTGEAAGDTYLLVEGLVGSDFTDSLRVGNGGGSIFARGGADSLFGGTGADDLHGQDGTDHLFGGAGADVLDGGAGTDFANYSTAAAGLTVNLIVPGNNTGEAAGDSYLSIEGVVGSNFADVLRIANGGGSIFARGGADQVNGATGSDDLHGMDGNDTLNGWAGLDVLDGGAGNDTFVFSRGEANGDTVLDFAGNGAAAGDSLLFVGYGTAAAGATITQQDATHWSINSADGLTHDIVAFSNTAVIHASDFLFA
jgi:Ca2+-binding RTX toxin-like protein